MFSCDDTAQESPQLKLSEKVRLAFSKVGQAQQLLDAAKEEGPEAVQLPLAIERN